MVQHGGATTVDSSSRRKANVDPERPPPLRQPFLGRETSRLDEAASLRHPLHDADTIARRQVSADCCSGILMPVLMLSGESACHCTAMRTLF